jgi:hypothetical protein
MDVVGETIVGRTDRDDRLERRRPPRRDLQGVEAAPTLAHHPDRARAPRLSRKPRDHLESVVLLLFQIFVVEKPIRVARAAHVDADRGIALFGKEPVHGFVAAARAVPLAIGNVLEDCRDGVRLGTLRPPQPRGEPRPVAERDPEILNNVDRHALSTTLRSPALPLLAKGFGRSRQDRMADRRSRDDGVGELPILRPRGLIHAPDFLVDAAVAIVGIEDVSRSAVISDVVGRHEMDLGHVARPGLLVERPVQFVDELPALLL